MRRRTLIKRGLATGIVGITGGLLTPGLAVAAYPKAAFDSEELAAGLTSLFGTSEFTLSSDITIKAPAIAQYGAVVPIQISTDIEAVESISILVEKNLNPFVATFYLFGSDAYISTRIKMKKTSDVLAVVKAGESLFSTSVEIKVTESACNS